MQNILKRILYEISRLMPLLVTNLGRYCAQHVSIPCPEITPLFSTSRKALVAGSDMFLVVAPAAELIVSLSCCYVWLTVAAVFPVAKDALIPMFFAPVMRANKD